MDETTWRPYAQDWESVTQLKEWRHAIGPLFDTPAITHSKAAFVQISPADERCRIGELVICNDSTSQWPELTGELFTIRPAKAV